MSVAIITGASRGLGLALAEALAQRGWGLVLTARGADALEEVAGKLRKRTRVTAIAGDVADDAHRVALVCAAWDLGGLDLLVNNASALGAEPLVRLEHLPLIGLREALETNVVAPLGLVQQALPLLRDSRGTVLNISSDAAVEAYPTWGGYGSSKAALEQLSAVLAEEEPDLRVWWVDPGDMRTALYAAACPDDDLSDRPVPEQVVPAFLDLLDRGAASGRYSAPALLAGAAS
ncbi:SDR family NAD(P)-dependent oxidoreductase [Wenjunlia tyrosinilytica]|nr:SDR family oxidoreductase [Wenjunlia tyrosinilytica]